MVTNTITLQKTTLKSTTKKAVLMQFVLLAAAIALPALCHTAGVSGSVILPMHWVVLLCGLVYGYRAGFIMAVAALGISYALTAMPPAFLLPVMAAELAVYGLVSGLCREKGFGYFASILTAIIAGRLIYISLGYILLSNFTPTILLPGLFAAAAQLIALPYIAKKWKEHLA